LSLLKKCLEIGRSRYGLVYGMPNTSAFSVCKRAGLVHIGDIRRFVRPLRLGLLLRRRNVGWMHWLQGPADVALHVPVAARAIWHRAPSHWRETGFDDPDVDAIWGLRPPYLSLAERSNQALDWRFNPAAGWKLELAYSAARQPVGYVVWRRRDDLVEVGDFFSQDPDRLTAALLAGFARRVRAETRCNGIELEFYGRPKVERGVLGAGFLRREIMCPLVLDRRPIEGEAATGRLYFTKFDRVSD
jgi:hypothetical protein